MHTYFRLGDHWRVVVFDNEGGTWQLVKVCNDEISAMCVCNFLNGGSGEYPWKRPAKEETKAV
jgi:hypothetical protein